MLSSLTKLLQRGGDAAVHTPPPVDVFPYKHDYVRKVLNTLHKYLPHDKWFVCGSVANPMVATEFCKDIDVFFYTAGDFIAADKAFRRNQKCSRIHASSCANTYMVPGLTNPIQLVCKHTGTPEEVFDTFDLNVVQYAVLSDGKHLSGPLTTSTFIKVLKPSANTVSRVKKYAAALRYSQDMVDEVWKKIVDEYIASTIVVDDYYEEKKQSSKLFSQLIYEQLHNHRRLGSYVKAQAEKHAPELLI